jgi:hypothetical protein
MALQAGKDFSWNCLSRPIGRNKDEDRGSPHSAPLSPLLANTIMFAIRIGVLPGDPADLKQVNALQDWFALTDAAGLLRVHACL